MPDRCRCYGAPRVLCRSNPEALLYRGGPFENLSMTVTCPDGGERDRAIKRRRRFKTAFILGAGLGTRLRPLTDRCPKPLLLLNGKPIIAFAMDHLLSVGVERFVVNTHHCSGLYGEAFPDAQWRGRPILFRHEPILLDTGGGLKNIEDLLEDDEAILCYNGDIVTDLSLETLIATHERTKPEITLVLRSSGPLLNVVIDAVGRVCDMRDMLGNTGVRRCLFTGIYAIETSVLRFIPAGRVESVVDLFVRRICDRPGSVRGVVADEGSWNDIGSKEIYDSLRGEVR
jgi:mannose-1-phosphate guanylyltransferase